jgi:tartrate dehydratase beta subunit/fumarate hydratase class I family protein
MSVLAVKAIRSVEDVDWLDLGVPEASWDFLEKGIFVSLVVAIGSFGTLSFGMLLRWLRRINRGLSERVCGVFDLG